MKNILFITSTLIVMALSSCYVEVAGEHRRHRMFWHPHPAARVEIRTGMNVNKNVSLQLRANVYADK